MKILVHILSIDKTILKTLKETLLSYNIKIDKIVAKSIAGANAAILNNEDKKDFLFLDIGAGSTEIAIISDGIIKTTDSIPFGGIYITNDIMKSINVDFYHAETINRYYSKLDKDVYGSNMILDCNSKKTTSKFISNDLLYDIIESRIEEIVQLIYNHIKTNLYDDNENFFKNLNIVIAGGCTNSNSFNNTLTKKFNCNIEIIDLKDLSIEYNFPQNACCYGIFQMAKHKFISQNTVNNKISQQNFSRLLENISKKIFKQEDQHA